MAVRELFEESGLTLTVLYLTMLSGAYVRVSLHEDKRQHVYVYSVSALVPYMNARLRTPAKVEHATNNHSTIPHDGS
jgi:ADP-ribose pyrophosphatase YjhB (NUDIX family)